MHDIDAAGFAFGIGLANGAVAMLTGSVFFGSAGLAFVFTGFHLLLR